MKRVFDAVVALLALLLLTPLLAVLALCVRWRLGAPVLFRQKRIGWKGREFDILKFRTMTDARDPCGALLPDEARLTPFGGFLRRTSLDELPELLNVLRGEMSLVGPRPLPVHYRERYSPEQWRRHEVRPGLTGWAQINGRNATTWARRFAHDLDYVEHHPFRRDLKILALTVLAVSRREGISAEGSATMHEFMGNETPDFALRRGGRSFSLSPMETSAHTDPVLEIVNTVRMNKKLPPVDSLRDGDHLRRDLGFDSLDLAELTVRLEERYGVDVFADGLVHTVAEVRGRLSCAS